MVLRTLPPISPGIRRAGPGQDQPEADTPGGADGQSLSECSTAGLLLPWEVRYIAGIEARLCAGQPRSFTLVPPRDAN